MIVRVLQRLRRLLRDAKRVLQRELPLPAQPVPQAFTFDIRHGEPVAPLGFAGVVDRQDVGVLEAGGELDLALEAVVAEARRRARDGAP